MEGLFLFSNYHEFTASVGIQSENIYKNSIFIFSFVCRYETSDGVTREESAVVEQSGDDQDGSTSRTVRGSYSYPSPDGRIISVEYVADRDGFRTTGNHLPAAKMHRAQYVVLK